MARTTPQPVSTVPADPFAAPPGQRVLIPDRPRADPAAQMIVETGFRPLPGRRNLVEKPSNLPIESDRSRSLRAAAEEAVAKTAEQRKAAGYGAGRNRWVKLGLQPGEKGYTLYVETFEGDKRIKEVVKRGLSPLAAREQLALHMSGLWAGF